MYSLADANLIMEHALSTYFRHYNLYQYAFTTRHFLDIELSGRIWECAPPIRPLSEASTEVEWNAILEEKERLAQEERERIAAEEEAALEIARRDALIAEYEAQVPETVRTHTPLVMGALWPSSHPAALRSAGFQAHRGRCSSWGIGGEGCAGLCACSQGGWHAPHAARPAGRAAATAGTAGSGSRSGGSSAAVINRAATIVYCGHAARAPPV